MLNLGRQGFNSPAIAEKDARNTLYGIPFCVLEKNGDFAWASPISYAKKLVDSDVRINLILEHKK